MKIRRLAHAKNLPLPQYQTTGAAGFDLAAAVSQDAPVTIKPGERTVVPTGLVFELPNGFEAQIRPRSGLAAKFGITVLNSPGTVDADYRGEVAVILINLGQEPFTVARGDRIAQAVIAEVARVDLKEAKAVKSTQRGSGGFGSTGVGTAGHASERVPGPKRASAPKTSPRPRPKT